MISAEDISEQRELQLRELAYGPILRHAFAAEGLPLEWAMAFGYVESGFRPEGHNNGKGDRARGGAWGICQMTLLTARELGFKGKPEDLYDPATCAMWAAKLIKTDIMPRVGSNFLDVAACYNGGHNFANSSPKAKAYANFINVVVQRYVGKYDHELLNV